MYGRITKRENVTSVIRNVIGYISDTTTHVFHSETIEKLFTVNRMNEEKLNGLTITKIRKSKEITEVTQVFNTKPVSFYYRLV